MKRKLYIYNQKWSPPVAEPFFYRYNIHKTDDDTVIHILNSTFVIRTTFGKIKHWFSWYCDLVVEIVLPNHIEIYARHFELWAKLDPPLKIRLITRKKD